MRYFLLFLLVLIISDNVCFCYTFTKYEPPEVIVNDYTTYPKISKIENIIFKKTYENEAIEKRLERLEKETCSRTFTGADLAWRTDNIIANINQNELYDIPSKDLKFIEKKILGRSYTKDNLNSRLGRLEQKMLGATQSGKPDERFQTILTASNHYTDFDTNNLMSFGEPLTLTQGAGLKGKLNNFFGSMFNSGCVTGFTPPISSYGNYIPYGFNPHNGTYGPRPYNFGSYNRFHPRYRYNNHRHAPHSHTGYFNSFGQSCSGCGIHILD